MKKWYEYDSNGNIIHFKNNNYEYWKRYDNNRKCIYFKDSTGYESLKQYNGNIKYTIDQTGKECWKTFDKNGNIINLKSINRYNSVYEEWQEYDKFGNMIRFKNTDGVDTQYKYEYDNHGRTVKKIVMMVMKL